MMPSTTYPSTQQIPFEAIEVRRIRLTQAAGASAVVSEFRTADRVPERWAGRGHQSAAHRVFSFEITFVDGTTFCGCYEFWHAARRRPSLTRFVRGQLSACGMDLSRYAIDVN
ncbi:hypothetical protein [Massilia sp. S19_KUP03_FR1]|uniref:hypothetical protein n=1 Tax=Massilia sp. S19_KUP03_FR1 TaxID=3025503 RepID=UPI002FCD8419